MLSAYVREALRSIRYKRRLGQHFLVDDTVASRIASFVNGEDVYEVGCGLGSLTLPLSERSAYVFCCEKDEVLALFLSRELYRRGIGNVDIMVGDALRIDLSRSSHLVVSNTPFNISSQLVVKLCYDEGLLKAYLGLQREVAERLYAKPGTREYGRLSVISQLCFSIERLFDVPPNAFLPPPKVFTSFVRLVPLRRLGAEDVRLVEEFSRRIFPYINRVVTTALRIGLGVNREVAEDLVRESNVLGSRRVREINPEEVLALARQARAKGLL